MSNGAGIEWRFLVVEDRDDFVRQLREVLPTCVDPPDTVTVDVHSTFSEAVEQLKHEKYDVIILDLKDDASSSVDAEEHPAGLKVFEELKKTRFTPVVFYTALAHKVRSEQTSFVRVVEKTESILRVKEEVKRVLEVESASYKTPERVERSFRFLTKGYQEDVGALLNSALFTVSYDEMVVVKDIEVFSLCEHHLLPFFGKAHVAYIPKDKVVGLSKIPRLVDAFARRLQVQERLTVQIAHALQDAIRPGGVGVVIEAMHLCMIMRGVEKQNSVAVTSCMLGAFREQSQTREEFLSLIKKKHVGLS